MDYTGYASNLSDKTRWYIERNGDSEQKLNYFTPTAMFPLITEGVVRQYNMEQVEG